MKNNVLYLGRYDCPFSDIILDEIHNNFEDVSSHLDGDPHHYNDNEEIFHMNYDYIFAFRSRIIVPKHAISASKIAVNAHPGPPEHPGSACINWALYNQDSKYGSTLHFISDEIDSGDILEVRYFNINDKDNIQSVLRKSYVECCSMFLKLISNIDNIDSSFEDLGNFKWIGKARLMKSLEEINYIDKTMSDEEILRRIRATNHESYPTKLNLDSGAQLCIK